MSGGEKIMEGLQEALAIARGDLPAARVTVYRLPPWQPIETAPKGELLLYFPERDKGGRNHLLAMLRIGYVSQFPHRHPSHWMPLPEPPVTP